MRVGMSREPSRHEIDGAFKRRLLVRAVVSPIGSKPLLPIVVVDETEQIFKAQFVKRVMLPHIQRQRAAPITMRSHISLIGQDFEKRVAFRKAEASAEFGDAARFVVGCQRFHGLQRLDCCQIHQSGPEIAAALKRAKAILSSICTVNSRGISSSNPFPSGKSTILLISLGPSSSSTIATL
jgi:hypothetical protein